MTTGSASTGVSLPERLQEHISRRLMESIVGGDRMSGDRLSPTKLASEFGTSHIPVREALAALEAEGYVRRVPRVGFFVAELSAVYLENVYQCRRLLEDEAHRLAIPKLDDSDIDRMRELNETINQSDGARTKEFLELNRAFHFVAFDKTGSAILLRFLNQLWSSTRRYQNTMHQARASRALLRRHHDGLIEAFRARDVDLVNARMAEHRALTVRAIHEIACAETNA